MQFSFSLKCNYQELEKPFLCVQSLYDSTDDSEIIYLYRRDRNISQDCSVLQSKISVTTNKIYSLPTGYYSLRDGKGNIVSNTCFILSSEDIVDIIDNAQQAMSIAKSDQLDPSSLARECGRDVFILVSSSNGKTGELDQKLTNIGLGLSYEFRLNIPDPEITNQIWLTDSPASSIGRQEGLSVHFFEGYYLDEKYGIHFKCRPSDDHPLYLTNSIYHDTLYGIYSAILIDGPEIHLRTDRCGWSKVFFYRSTNDANSLFVASNSYSHLLIALASICHQELELDLNHVESLFFSNHTLLRQSPSFGLLVKDTFLLQPWQQISITASGVSFSDKLLHRFLADPVEFKSTSSIANDLAQGLSEVAANFRSILNSSYRNIVVDVSGGKDSRVNFALLASEVRDENEKNYYLNSSLNEPSDLDIALMLNECYGFKYWDENESSFMEVDFDRLLALKAFWNCGYYYIWSLPTHAMHSGHLRVSGESFEAFSVKYYSKGVACSDIGGLTARDIALHSVKETIDCGQSLVPQFQDSTIKILTNTINQIPGQWPIVKFDNLFFLLRGRFHAGNHERFMHDPDTIMPLQSLHLLRAKNYAIRHHDSDIVIFDLTKAIDPLLASIAYNSAKTNESYKDYAGSAHAWQSSLACRRPSRQIKIEIDKTDESGAFSLWNQAYLRRMRNVPSHFSGWDGLSGKEEYLAANSLACIAFLLANGPVSLREALLSSGFFIVNNLLDRIGLRVLHHKLISLRLVATCMSKV